MRQLHDRTRDTPDTTRRSTDFADRLTLLAAAIATIVAGQGMWQFLDRVIGDIPALLRGLMFAFLEISVITSAVRARRNMRANYSAGIDGLAVWLLTSVSAVLSALEARTLPEVLFRLAAPLVAAWLWDRGMALERRRLRGRVIHWRLTPERLLVRLGLAEASDRTASEVDAQRRIARVALAAKRARALPAGRKRRRALARLDRRLEQAVEHAGLACDPVRQTAMLDQIGALYASSKLLTLPEVAPWEALDHPLTATPAADPIVSGGPAETSTDTPPADPAEMTPADTSPTLDADTSNVSDDADEPSAKRPDPQDNREAERWIRDRMRTGKTPTQADVSTRYGFSNGWASDRIKAARADLSAKGWTFGARGVVKPPGGKSDEAHPDTPEAAA
jgi:hypothetical protein